MSELRSLSNQYHQVLPDRDSRPVSKTGNEEAWMMQMERAQFADWFQYSPPVGTAVPATLPAPVASVTLDHPSTLPPEIALHQTAYHIPDSQPTTTHLPAEPAVDVRRITPTRHQSDVFGVNVSVVELRTRIGQVLDRVLSRIQANDALTCAIETHSTREQQRLNIHLEPLGDNVLVAVWIGVSAHDPVTTENLATLRDALQRSLHEKGLRLGTLTLNGRLVWQADVHQENG